MRAIIEGLRDLWCDYTHGGGHIERDPLGRVNWQCDKCGRWSTPVPPEDERKTTDYAIWCADSQRTKIPAECWNVRCQLGNRCCRAPAGGA